MLNLLGEGEGRHEGYTRQPDYVANCNAHGDQFDCQRDETANAFLL